MRTTLIALAMLSSAAYAQPQCTNLVYQGAPFTSLVTTGANSTPLIPLSGTITLSAPLPPNADNIAVIPAAWNFSSEKPGYESGTPGVYGGQGDLPIYFSTDSNGNIIGWQIGLGWGAEFGTESSSQTGDFISAASGPDVVINGISTTPGTWSCQPPPPVNPLAAEVAQLKAQVAQETYDAAYWYDAYVYWYDAYVYYRNLAASK